MAEAETQKTVRMSCPFCDSAVVVVLMVDDAFRAIKARCPGCSLESYLAVPPIRRVRGTAMPDPRTLFSDVKKQLARITRLTTELARLPKNARGIQRRKAILVALLDLERIEAQRLMLLAQPR